MISHLHPYNINHLHDAEYIKRLGEGAFGTIKLYKCKEKENGCTCNQYFVVKCMKKNKRKKTDAYLKHLRKCLLNEYTIGTLLRHPCIRETLDVDFKDHCIIFEYCPGSDFLDLINENKLTMKDEIYYFKQLIDGVSYMHDIGIAHMDLKLENIMIDYVNKKVKIIDLGKARIFHDSLHISTVIKDRGIHGSLPYIAPEEFSDEEYNPEKIDVWSCGIILFEIIYHLCPWRKACKRDSLYRNYLYYRNNDKIDGYLSHISSRELILTMLNPNPDERCHLVDIKDKLIALD